jgi:WD40 repeat protein/DNA-binding SARP family transcriptional activator
MPHLTLTFLGSFQAALDGVPIGRFQTDKVRALLAYLVLEADRPHSRASLCGLLWPEQSDDAALHNLSQTLRRLREALGDTPGPDSFLSSSRQSLQWNLASDHELDAASFARLAASSIAAELEQAVALYRGELLPGFGLPGCEAFEEWLLLMRERYAHLAILALESLARAQLAAGAYRQAEHHARRLLALDPWREVAHRQLMQALAASGDRAAALAAYERCRQLLRDDLGVEPDAETRTLYEQIHSGVRYEVRGTSSALSEPERKTQNAKRKTQLQDWSDAPEVGPLYGRHTEAAQLEHWLLHERCRLIALLGIGGVGKTALAATTVQALAAQFEVVFWRSLLNAPPLDEVLPAALQVVSGHSLPDVPPSLDEQLALLLDYLRRRRCLLVLDNMESILQPGHPGAYQAGYAPYGRLIQCLGESRHSSCLLLTSREPPSELARLPAGTPALRVLRLRGLDAADGQAMLVASGLPSRAAEAGPLVARYSGNPLALKLVAQTVHELFGGDIGAFLAAEAPIFDDIRMVLDQQYARLSALEQELLTWLAIEREPVGLPALRANLVQPPSPRELLEALRTLQRRSLLEQVGRMPLPALADQPPSAAFTLQNVIMEYVTARLVDAACHAIERGEVDALDRYALLKAQSKEYVRHSQSRIIVQPIAERLLAHVGLAALEAQLRHLLASLRAHPPRRPGYAGGNILNLLLHLKRELRGYDFSGLSVWQADLRGVANAAVNFSHADLSHAAFTAVFSLSTLRFTGDGQLLVAGTVGDEQCVWRAGDGQLHGLFRRAGAGTSQLVFSHDGGFLAAGGPDHAVRVWSLSSGEYVNTLQGHADILYTQAFSADGQRLASSSRDGTVRVWDVQSGQLLHILHEYSTEISALAFSSDGTLLAGGGNRVICLWDTTSGQVIRTLLGHSREIECFVFSADDRWLVSGAHDGSIRLWDVASGQTLQTLHGHSQIVRAVALHPDGHTLASGGVDRLVRLWDLRDGQIVRAPFDHGSEIVSLGFSVDGQVLASGSGDPAVKLWDTYSGNALDTLRGHGEIIHSIDFSPNGRLLASSGATGMVRLWDIGAAGEAARGQVVRSWQGHARLIRSVEFSPDGHLLASAGADQVVQIWDVESGTACATFCGHTNTIKTLAFSPDGRVLASGGSDRTIRLWPVSAAGQTERVLRGHTDEIGSLVFSPDGRTLLSSSLDHTVRVWASDDGQEMQVLTARGCALSGAVFSPDGQLAVATAYDGSVHAWDVGSGRRLEFWSRRDLTALQVAFSPDGTRMACTRSDLAIEIRDAVSGAVLQTLRGYKGTILSLAFSPTEPILATGSWDGLIRIWDVESGTCLHTLRALGPYAGMNITGVTGITAAQRASLVALGAIDGAVA